MATRKLRMVTVRMAVVALVVGAVLTVVNVPVAAVVMQHQSRIVPPLGSSAPMFSMAEYFQRDGHLVVVRRRDFWGGTILEATSGPEGTMWLLGMAAAIPSAQLVDRDARPRAIRTPLDGHEHAAELWRAGWPLESACGVEKWSPGGRGHRVAGLLKAPAFGHVWTVPYWPAWWGLLGNTLFYAAIALAVLVFVRHRKRSRRRAAGKCVACGYELGGGVGTCPECGLVAAR